EGQRLDGDHIAVPLGELCDLDRVRHDQTRPSMTPSARAGRTMRTRGAVRPASRSGATEAASSVSGAHQYRTSGPRNSSDRAANAPKLRTKKRKMTPWAPPRLRRRRGD